MFFNFFFGGGILIFRLKIQRQVCNLLGMAPGEGVDKAGHGRKGTSARSWIPQESRRRLESIWWWHRGGALP